MNSEGVGFYSRVGLYSSRYGILLIIMPFFIFFRRKSPNPFGSSSNESSSANSLKPTNISSNPGANTSSGVEAPVSTVSNNPFGTPEDSPVKEIESNPFGEPDEEEEFDSTNPFA